MFFRSWIYPWIYAQLWYKAKFSVTVWKHLITTIVRVHHRNNEGISGRKSSFKNKKESTSYIIFPSQRTMFRTDISYMRMWVIGCALFIHKNLFIHKHYAYFPLLYRSWNTFMSQPTWKPSLLKSGAIPCIRRNCSPSQPS